MILFSFSFFILHLAHYLFHMTRLQSPEHEIEVQSIKIKIKGFLIICDLHRLKNSVSTIKKSD